MSAVLKPVPAPANVSDLAERLFAAKAAEKAATAARVAAEEELIAAVGFAKTEGQQTETIGDLKVTFKASLTRKLDWETFDAKIAPSMPEELQPVKVERKLDETGVKFLAENHPDLYKMLAKALTVTPAKVNVTIVRTA